jgi:hypothetical protein
VTAAPEHAAARTPPAPVAEAQATVRDFIAAAVLQHDAYLACQYLTPVEQRRVGRGRGAAPPRDIRPTARDDHARAGRATTSTPRASTHSRRVLRRRQH